MRTSASTRGQLGQVRRQDEADEAELLAYVSRRLSSSQSSMTEPIWLREACEAAWAWLLTRASA